MKLDLSKAAWRKSSRSGQSTNCVEVAGNLPHGVAIRDSKRPAGPALVVTRATWHAFTARVKTGQFDVRLAEAGQFGVRLAAARLRTAVCLRTAARPHARGVFCACAEPRHMKRTQRERD